MLINPIAPKLTVPNGTVIPIRAGIFLQFWEGTLGPFRLGKLMW